MKILVLGGSGFLGSFVADRLSFLGHDVIIYDKKKSKWLQPSQKLISGNILNYKSLEKAIKKVEIVYHFAALADLDEAFHKPLETVTNNILGTVNVLELSRKYKIKRIIYASSIYSMSSQGSFYRCSKKAAEDYIEEYYKRFGLNFTVIRYGSLYGLRTNRSNGVFRIIDDALENKKIQYVGNRNSIRRYIHVVDAARATVESMSSKYKNKYVNIVGTKFYKVTELLAIISKSLKISEKVQFLNVKMMGHYIKFPKLFRLRKGMNYKLKNHIKFKYGINSLIQNMKKTRKTIN